MSENGQTAEGELLDARGQIAAALRSEMQPGTSWDHRDVDDLADALMAHTIPPIIAEAARPGQELRARVEGLAMQVERDAALGFTHSLTAYIAARLRAALEDPR